MPTATATKKIKKPKPDWNRAKIIPIPIPKTGTKFRAYADDPPRPCEATARVRVVQVAEAFAWRYRLDTPLFSTDDPQCDVRKPAATLEKAVFAACANIIDDLQWNVDNHRSHGIKEVAVTLAAAIQHVERFAQNLRDTGRFLTCPAKLPVAQRPAPIAPAKKKPAGLLDAKGCRELLKQFRVAYEGFGHSFLELGEYAERVFEQEAYLEHHATFDRWIEAERYERSLVYSARKAFRVSQLTAPAAVPAKIVLEKQSHFDEFPAEATEKQARQIVKRLKEVVAADEDGFRRPTAREIKAVVAEVCPREARSPRLPARRDEIAEVGVQAAEVEVLPADTGHVKATKERTVHALAALKTIASSLTPAAKSLVMTDVGYVQSFLVDAEKNLPAEISAGRGQPRLAPPAPAANVEAPWSETFGQGPALTPPGSDEYKKWNGKVVSYGPLFHDLESDLVWLIQRWRDTRGFARDMAELLQQLAEQADPLSTMIHGRRAK